MDFEIDDGGLYVYLPRNTATGVRSIHRGRERGQDDGTLGDAYGVLRTQAKKRGAAGRSRGRRRDVSAWPNRAWDVDSDAWPTRTATRTTTRMKNPSRERTRRSTPRTTPRTTPRRRRERLRRRRAHRRTCERSGGVASRDRLPTFSSPPSRPPPPRRARQARVDRMLTSSGTTGRRERDAARAGERERERERDAAVDAFGVLLGFRNERTVRASRPARHDRRSRPSPRVLPRRRGPFPSRSTSTSAPAPAPVRTTSTSTRTSTRTRTRCARRGNARASRRRAVHLRGIERGTPRCRRSVPAPTSTDRRACRPAT